ncbi:BKRF1 encodes EBNA-1 protein,latent cycle gene-like [Oryza sativa Japonica Group]|uniref:BKRF1 encodes EBNA-1 protein,latent cycle gene-like n=1 Tax=Oryza sativa subsp. japonica TaxID=39947 RepID=Q657L1_ORYSJ|nr:BKRF1 encodes EBNA-1 protein,latent cycle gene-like [Oryza sativa Japonica Group]
MTMTVAAQRDDEPGDRRDVDDENEWRRRRWTAEGFGWRGSDAEDDLAAAIPEKTTTRSTGEIPARRMERPARHDGVPAKYGRRRGLAGEEDGVPVPGEVVATSAGARETRQRRPEAEQWRQRHCCQRGRVSGDFPTNRRRRRGRGCTCEAEGEDGAAGRRSGEEGEAAGGRPAPEREKEKAGRGGAATERRGRRLKR